MKKPNFFLCFMLTICSTSASAVYLNPRGLGQVLLFSYYTVRPATNNDTYNTLIVVTNTTADTKVVRVRFHEARNAREVANFNVYLTPHDSWTAAVTPGTLGPVVTSRDQSCFVSSPAASGGVVGLSNFGYSGLNADGEAATLDRSSEGFVEVIDMGTITDSAVIAALNPTRNAAYMSLPVQPDCAAVKAVVLHNGQNVATPSGGLMGSAFIINVPQGTLYPYDAIALDNFTEVPLYIPTGQPAPSLQDVNPKIAYVFDATGLRVTHWDPARGAHPGDPVSAVLMQNHILNQFVLDQATDSGTAWVVTMPTKAFYVQLGPAGRALPPFESAFVLGGSPDNFGVEPTSLAYGDKGNSQFYDREGAFIDGSFSFGPNPPEPLMRLSWATNVINFRFLPNTLSANLFGSKQAIEVHPLAPNGWARLEPYQYSASSPTHKLVSTDVPPVTLYGLPMIGFMANSYRNGELPGPLGPVLSNYGATALHKGNVRIQ